MRKIGTNIMRMHLTEFAAIGVVVVLVIAIGLRLYSESPATEEGEQSPEENGEQPQSKENEEPQPTPARFEVSDLVIEPNAISTSENINVSVKVTNIGDLEGTYLVVLKINDMEMGREEITLVGEETTVVLFTKTIWDTSLWGVTCDVSVGELTGTFRVRDISWWDDAILRETANVIFGEYYTEHMLGISSEGHSTFKGEPLVGMGWNPYDREGDVVVIEGNIIYGTVPNLKETKWFAEIDLNIYQVVEFYEITG